MQGEFQMKKKDFTLYLRSLVVGVETKIPLADGKKVTAINFDNAATTPPFFSVLQEIMDFAPWYSSVHRGKGYKSVLSSDIYEKGREVIGKFVNADLEKDLVIYTKNTTESLNMLAYILYQKDSEQIILTTEMEHLSNDLPWRNKFKVLYTATNAEGKLCLDDMERKLKKYGGKIKLVTVTGASNVTGYLNPIHRIAKLAHQYGAKILVDAAQLVPHAALDMKSHNSLAHIDYLAFSSHKMYAPFGIGILIAPKETFAETKPVYQGGGTVRLVSHKFIEWDEAPAKEEAGTPNVIGVSALVQAIKILQSIGMDNIYLHEECLVNYALKKIRSIPEVCLYTYAKEKEKKLSIIPFNIEGIHHSLVAQILSLESGIAVRNGLFCAHPYAEKLLQLTDADLEYYRQNHQAPFPGMVRMSLGLYNNFQEIDILVEKIKEIVGNKKDYQKKYKRFFSRQYSR